MQQQEKMVAFWLVPTRDQREFFSSLIDLLAVRCDAQRFEPHVTLFGGRDIDPERADDFLSVATNIEAIQMDVERIGYSDEYTKTLYVQFARSRSAEALGEAIRRATGSKSEYQLNPHLSLVYKDLPEQEKVELARSIELPLETVTFDVVRAITGNAATSSNEDVASWRTLAERRLKR
jgi:2'-5' RNA ligase